jgi:hypothetical protein
MDRTTAVISLVAAALREAFYTVPGPEGGVSVLEQPAGLEVVEQPIYPEGLGGPKQAVFPITEDALFGSMGGGVVDSELIVAVESVVPAGIEPSHRTLSPFRNWAWVALVNNAALNAVLREPVEVRRTRWLDPEDLPQHRLHFARCVQVFSLKHRTMYSNPSVSR